MLLDHKKTVLSFRLKLLQISEVVSNSESMIEGTSFCFVL